MILLDFETETALFNIARGLRTSRLARNDTCEMAAKRIGVGVATYKRMENPEAVGKVALQTILSALSVYGHEKQVLELGIPSHDAQLPEYTKETRQRASGKKKSN